MHDILIRTSRRAGRLLREWLPYHAEFRPTGIHESSQELAAHPGSKAAYFGVEPAALSTLTVSDDFYAQASAYAGLHDKPHRQEHFPEGFVVQLPNGRVYADNWNSVAIIAADGKLVGDVCFQYDSRIWNIVPPNQNSIFRQRYFVPPLRIKGTVCSILSGGGAASGNYYHWLIDSLPRLHLVEKAGLLAQTDYVLVYDKTKAFVVDTLGHLGFSPDRILDVREHPHLQADQLLATSSVRGVLTHTPQWACDFLRRALLPPAATSRTFSPLVYISRRDAPGRHVRNEEALEALLAEYGFETHTLSPYSQAEKIALFAQAQIIVSPVGAGLANLVFCAPGTHLIELLPKSFVVPDFLELSSRLDIHHHFLVCPDQHMSTTRSNAQRDHLTVDLSALRLLVEQALQPAPATV